ncbi:RNA-binding domain-containing protein [Asticcacaulis sp.]|uniref:RNA-binding domain-containing protein n=1 Tax=Asticcacaulis sp. TaxID=1872648 RepID=UPI00262785A8|nr:RNA-binding domain-containing protein [Asticcacaulis sp.]
MENSALVSRVDGFRRKSHEGETFEFKSNLSDPKKIGEYIAGLGNSAALERHERAWLIWGVDDESHAVTGTTFNPFKEKFEGNQALIMGLNQSITPKPDFQFHEVVHPDGRLVVLEIHAPRALPLAYRGTRYIRVESHVTALTGDKEARLFEVLNGKDDWSGHVVDGATLADLDRRAIDFARTKFKEYLGRNQNPEADEVDKWDDVTLLNKARVTKQGRITRTAILLLGKDEAQHFLSPADTKISWILKNEQSVYVSGQHYGLPFLLSSEALFQKVRNLTLEYMPDGTLFPTPVSQYDNWVIREALHNAIAHQDYRLGGKINVVEFPDRLVISNLGSFMPPSVEWMLEHQSPPEHYRNQWLIDAMIRLRMIDQMGSGIRRMFEIQRERFFPLPDFLIGEHAGGMMGVEVSITGKIFDPKYVQVLMRRSDLNLDEVILLDRVQKNIPIPSDMARKLRSGGLIEGRSPNHFISSKVADLTDQKASYIRNRAFDDGHYRAMIIEFLKKFQRATRSDFDGLLLEKMSEVLSEAQKRKKIANLLQGMRNDALIVNSGTNRKPIWELATKND